jgi:hypothetical protein
MRPTTIDVRQPCLAWLSDIKNSQQPLLSDARRSIFFELVFSSALFKGVLLNVFVCRRQPPAFHVLRTPRSQAVNLPLDARLAQRRAQGGNLGKGARADYFAD